MPVVVKMFVVVANLAKVFLKAIIQLIQKHPQNQTVILTIQLSIMKMIFPEIYESK